MLLLLVCSLIPWSTRGPNVDQLKRHMLIVHQKNSLYFTKNTLWKIFLQLFLVATFFSHWCTTERREMQTFPLNSIVLLFSLRWQHPLHPFLKEPRADRLMGASIMERSPSLLFPPRHLSVHLPPCPRPAHPPRPFWKTLKLVHIACQNHNMYTHRRTHKHTGQHGWGPPFYYRSDAALPTLSPLTFNLCFLWSTLTTVLTYIGLL